MRKAIKHLCLWCILVCFMISCSTAEFYPEDGQWYCKELQIQLSFDDLGACYCRIGEEVIACACGSDPGSRWLSVGCQETDSAYFELGEEVFGAEFVSLDGEKLVVFDPKTETEYIFYRVK